VDLFLSPPVRSQIEKAMRWANGPKKESDNRRRGETQPARDIKFRWRPRERGPRARDPQT
jgi:hypothetical protein